MRLQHDRDGKHRAMEEIRSAWLAWRDDQGPHAGTSLNEFLRAMQEAHPAILNPGSIKNAIKRWRSG
jgi:hypothetical protein